MVAQGFETLDTYYLVDQQATFDFTHLESFYVPIGTHANPFKGNFNGNKKTIHLRLIEQLIMLVSLVLQEKKDSYKTLL